MSQTNRGKVGRKILTVITAVVSFHVSLSPSQAGDVAVLFGGSGGITSDGSNGMEAEFQAFHHGLATRGWDVRRSFFAGGRGPGTAASKVENVFPSTKEALDAAKSGDQVLIVFDGHGAKAQDGQKSHPVLMENGELMNLDSLAPLIQTATSRGAKVALVDLSCYSGNTQKLAASTGACVASLSPETYFGFGSAGQRDSESPGDFVEGFMHHLPPKGTAASLQDHYSRARAGDQISLNFPQLSSLATPAASGWSTFFKSSDPSGTKREEEARSARSGYFNVLGMTGAGDVSGCAKDPYGFEAIESQLASAMAPLNIEERKNLDGTRVALTKALKDYAKLLENVEADSKNLNSALVSSSWHHPSQFDMSPLAVTDMVDRNPRVTVDAGELRRETELANLSDNFSTRQSSLTARAREIMKLERQFYRKLESTSDKRGGIATRVMRSAVQMITGKENNPCQSFHL